MPKETRKPKSDCGTIFAEMEREGSAFWNWANQARQNGFTLCEEYSDKTPPANLMERTAQFGERIVRFAKKIPPGINHPENNRLIDQLVGAGTSIGANYAEADDAVSGKDFKNKIGISPQGIQRSHVFPPHDCRFGRKPCRRSSCTLAGSKRVKPDFWLNLEKVDPMPKEIYNTSIKVADFEFGFRLSAFGFRIYVFSPR